MILYSIHVFRHELKKLVKKHASEYGSCAKDICAELSDKSVEQLTLNNKIILRAKSYNILKIRVGNSARKKGKSGSFRIIVAASKTTEEVILLYVYPKTGPQGKENISDEFRDDLLKNLIIEKSSSELTPVDISNNLEEIITQ